MRCKVDGVRVPARMTAKESKTARGRARADRKARLRGPSCRSVVFSSNGRRCARWRTSLARVSCTCSGDGEWVGLGGRGE